jgi:hypothetical protein
VRNSDAVGDMPGSSSCGGQLRGQLHIGCRKVEVGHDVALVATPVFSF